MSFWLKLLTTKLGCVLWRDGGVGRVCFSHASSILLLLGCLQFVSDSPIVANEVTAVLSPDGDSVVVERAGGSDPILTQVARVDFRPYLHPIAAPDGAGLLTQHSPDHHPHQTGLYWGFTRINGRDFFHHPGGDYWKRVSVTVLNARASAASESVQWQTVYDLLDEEGNPLLRQSQIWSLRDTSDGYTVELQWNADAQQDIVFGQYDYGGLFLRMPWSKGTPARVVNSARQVNSGAEGQRAVWLDVGVQVDGRDDAAHVAMFDHPTNRNFPNAWRVDGQFGVGPAINRLGEWNIKAGQSAALKFGFLMYGGQLSDSEITEHWSEFSGQPMPYAQWDLARKEGRNAKFLTPEQAVAEMTVTDGFEANVFAAEPMITQPMAFCWDDRGRMWVAENRDYENRRTGFSGSGDSRIVILEDTDRDGVADSRKVFAEGIPFPAAMAVGMGGLWLGAPPNLLFIPDADQDDRADLDDVQVRLTGWGIRDRHETLNSFHWGPDGWLYGLQGFATPSTVGRPAAGGKVYAHGEPYPEDIEFEGPTTKINGGVWRYHPTKERFEVVAHGFSNPWGIDYDKHGQLFITACVIPHLWHIVPGGIYHRQGGTHFSDYVYDDIKTIADHRHRSAHGGARIYQSDAFPDRYQDRIFMANIHEHAVLTDVLKPQGSGFVGVHGDDFLLANNAQWVGFSVEIGPDGNVYVLDWHDADICGSDVLNKETGRVFRIAPTQSAAKDFADRHVDVASLSDLELAELQQSRSDWHARRARTVLQHRATKSSIDGSAVTHLKRLLERDESVPTRLRALWGLHVTGELDHQHLRALLQDQSDHVRGWAVQLLCEDGSAGSQVEDEFIQMAATDSSAVVRLFLASAIQRSTEPTKWGIADGLVRQAVDATDHNLPKMIWFGIEPMVATKSSKAIDLASRSELPMITRHVMRRLADDNQLEAVAKAIADSVAEGNRFNTDSESEDDSKAHAMLMGLRDSMDGRFDLQPPANWSSVVDLIVSMKTSSQEVTRQLSQQFGDQQIAAEVLAVVSDRNADIDDRRSAVQVLAAQRHPDLRARLHDLLAVKELRTAVIRASASYEDRRFAAELLDRYDDLTADEKLETVLALSSRSNSGRLLTDAIRTKRIDRSDIPAYVARSLQRVVGNGFVEVWGPMESIGVEKQALFTKYRELLKPDAIAAADAEHGRAVFRKTCYACHRLNGEGGNVGPDITGANRSNLDYLLSNILTPSAEIQDAYRMQMILTDDGRVFSGIPSYENDRQLKLRVANQTDPITISKAAIESREVAKVSMMPAGIMDELSEDDVKDLFAYLQTIQPGHQHDETE